MKKIKYDGGEDKECIPLCNALNSIPGIYTRESCCGHNMNKFYVTFYVSPMKYVNNIQILLKNIDNHYWVNMKTRGFKNWNCSVISTEFPGLPIWFMLDSGTLFGSEAYKQANKIARGIIKSLKSLPHRRNLTTNFIFKRRKIHEY
jgi:hypothetical protein